MATATIAADAYKVDARTVAVTAVME